ncbi:YhdP family protein [Methylotenera mobilis]|uniref:YhdP central domain-containing protein n=1 Tax=Methylotenera mobilis (strain JLW8 / ATCC BAA-1282 / DSM 17540) TaxID=583345 RepID=C6WWM2_METML|nr:YhdP family protein [Methylotenera mobilis]ACT48321.1 conserved hypothetical protein [Methylotenera mobilis JLW8]
MVKKSLLWVYRTLLWLTGITAIIMVAVALTIHFWLMPNIGELKNQIASFASQSAKQKITIGDIQADWQGINPHLLLNNVDLFDAQDRVALKLKTIDVRLSWLSVPLLEPHLAELVIRDPALTIRRTTDGEIFVAGISMAGESNPDLANWLLRQNKLAITNAKVLWLDELKHAPELSLNQLNVELLSPPWRSLVRNHSFTVSALPSTGSRYPIQITGSFYGNDVRQTQNWHGNIHLQLKSADLAAYKTWVDYPVDLKSGIGSTNLIIDFAQHEVQSINSHVALANIQLLTKPHLAPLMLDKLSGNIVWKNLSKTSLLSALSKSETKFGQSLSVTEFNASALNGLNLKDVKANYTQTIDGKQDFNLSVPNLSLANVQASLSQLPLPEPLVTPISAINPQGELKDLDVVWQAQNTVTQSYQVATKFNQLTTSAYQHIPGVSNLSGELKANQKSGVLSLDSKQAYVDAKGTLRWPIPFDTLEGKITWDIKPSNTKINVNALSMSSPHLSGTLDASYLMDGKKGGHLDLKGKFNNGNAKYAKFYYPTMLGETTINWLDTSILEGKANDINVTVKGRLADFPFVDSKNHLDPKLGLFRVTAKVSDALLEYGTDWPVIEKLGLDLLFEGNRMELNAHSGHIFGNQIIKNKTTIAQLDADYPILNVQSELQGPVSEGIVFVNKSPVHTLTEGFTDTLKTSGSGKLGLGLSIPLADVDASKYKGIYQITNGKMESDDIPTLTQINGNLEFTEASLSAKNIKAYAFGSPLAFNLSSAKDKSIRVQVKGKLSDSSIKQMLKDQSLPKASDYISGSAEWLGDILIQKPRVNIGIRSDLVGITSTLPIPFDKNANQPLSLRVDKKIDGNTSYLFVNLGNKAGAKITSILKDGKFALNNANIQLGGDIKLDPAANNDAGKPPGIAISGNLDYLNADAWRFVAKNLVDPSSQSVKLPIQKVAVTIKALDIFNRRINQVNISELNTEDNLRLTLQSKEITGNLQWIDHKNGKLIARLSNFTIPETAPDQLSAASSATDNKSLKQFTKLAQDYPALDITADNFVFQKKNLGSLELIAYPENDNWDIQKIKFNTPEGTISAEGQWNNWVRNANTSLNVRWDIKDLGQTLARLGYADTIMEGEGKLTGQLRWPGSPHQFDTTRLSGELKFEVRKGQILQVQPGVGRLLGLLSLQSLPRRLTLDFRDLFSNGFAFDKINATVKIDQGTMRSDNFRMAGPAADVRIKGEISIPKETQHLFVNVSPRISDSISLAALAGGPLVGAVAFLAQKVLKDPLNKIASTDYEIIGTWDTPQEVKPEDESKKNQSNPLIN